MVNRYTLSKNERLKSLKAIRQLFDHGNKFKAAPLLIYFHIEKASGNTHDSFPLKMGVSVGAKYFRKAVQRNLLKRRMREAFRTKKIPLLECMQKKHLRMNVFFVYSYATMVEYQLIASAMEAALQKLIDIIEKTEQHDG